MKTEIIASTTRRANGWAAVLEYPNGGRQVFAQRFGTMESALRDAQKLLRVRLAYPDGVIADPQPNQLMDLGADAGLSAHGEAVATWMAIHHPNTI